MTPRLHIGALVLCVSPFLAVLPNLTSAQTDEDMTPLSAIDWLSQSVEQPPTVAVAPVQRGTQANRTPSPDEAPVANSATSPSVSVRPLGAPAPRALGLLAPSLTGLPANLWVGSDAATVTALLQAQNPNLAPPLKDLLQSLILTQAAPPMELDPSGAFFLARIDKLLDMGAIEPAQAMLIAATPDSAATFQRWFDTSLLTGTETAACRALKQAPDVAPTPAARVFCLARSGDWSAAALTLNTSRALGDLSDDTANLLARFLDPELFEGEPALPRPDRITPLKFRMFEAIGDPLGTQGLPLAFVHADLRPNVGWKAQLEAAERLAQRGAIDTNALIGLYTARRPAASGGVWERARAVQGLQDALAEGRNIGPALDALWREAEPRGLMPALAPAFGEALLATDLPPAHRSTLFRTLLLTENYEAAALIDVLADTDPFLASVARGTPSDARFGHPQADVIRAAFTNDPAQTLTSGPGQTGEAILRTLATLEQGLDGDTMALQDGLTALRALGLEDVARRTALHLLILGG